MLNDDEEYLRPSQEDIDKALIVENEVLDTERLLYLECMNNVPMSQRKTARDQRDGCILTGMVYWLCSGYPSENYPYRNPPQKKKSKKSI